MIEIVPTDTCVLAVRLSGIVDRQDIDLLEASLGAKLDKCAKIVIHLNCVDLSDVAADAILLQMPLWLGTNNWLDRIERGAFICDKQWLRFAIQYLDRHLERPRLRAFASADHQQAASWLQHVADR